VRLEEPKVGRHPSAALEDDDVPGHDRGRIDLRGLPLAHNNGAGRHQPAQTADRRLGLALLREADQCIDGERQRDYDRVDALAQREAEHERDNEDDDERALELTRQDLDVTRGRRLRQRVGTEPPQPFGGILLRQPRRCRVELARHIRGLTRVPRSCDSASCLIRHRHILTPDSGTASESKNHGSMGFASISAC